MPISGNEWSQYARTSNYHTNRTGNKSGNATSYDAPWHNSTDDTYVPMPSMTLSGLQFASYASLAMPSNVSGLVIDPSSLPALPKTEEIDQFANATADDFENPSYLNKQGGDPGHPGEIPSFSFSVPANAQPYGTSGGYVSEIPTQNGIFKVYYNPDGSIDVRKPDGVYVHYARK